MVNVFLSIIISGNGANPRRDESKKRIQSGSAIKQVDELRSHTTF